MEKPHWKTDRIIGTKLDRYAIPKINMLHNNKDDNDSEYSNSTEEEKDER